MDPDQVGRAGIGGSLLQLCSSMRGGRCGAEAFSAETIAEEGGGDADEGRGFYENFAAVEEVGVAIF